VIGRSKSCQLNLRTRDQWPKDKVLQNAHMATLFVSFDTKSLTNGEKFVQHIYGNPNFPQANKFFFPNSYKLHNLYILMDFYSCKVCPMSSQSHGLSVKHPCIMWWLWDVSRVLIMSLPRSSGRFQMHVNRADHELLSHYYEEN
jgi:hypothetical protein